MTIRNLNSESICYIIRQFLEMSTNEEQLQITVNEGELNIDCFHIVLKAVKSIKFRIQDLDHYELDKEKLYQDILSFFYSLRNDVTSRV